MAELLIENLHKRYGPVKAIDDVNIHVADGEFVTLLGPSGCGKSTTLGAIAGLDQPTSGRIRVGNKTYFDGEKGSSCRRKRAIAGSCSRATLCGRT